MTRTAVPQIAETNAVTLTGQNPYSRSNVIGGVIPHLDLKLLENATLPPSGQNLAQISVSA